MRPSFVQAVLPTGARQMCRAPPERRPHPTGGGFEREHLGQPSPLPRGGAVSGDPERTSGAPSVSDLRGGEPDVRRASGRARQPGPTGAAVGRRDQLAAPERPALIGGDEAHVLYVDRAGGLRARGYRGRRPGGCGGGGARGDRGRRGRRRLHSARLGRPAARERDKRDERRGGNREGSAHIPGTPKSSTRLHPSPACGRRLSQSVTASCRSGSHAPRAPPSLRCRKLIIS